MDFVAPSLLLLLGLTAPQVSDLKAEYRDGQTFLTWRESGDLADARFEVWSAAQPLTSLAGAVCEAKGLLPGSAVDWWLNPETYGAP
ncbi:MAG: hypothetical protein HUU35_06935, partial [Armatimonadetes bacterium]|nr:hypothetical protein [Armatimonadota bacterium]